MENSQSKGPLVKLTVLYDNHPSPDKRLKADWGFACLVQGLEKNILFDTGAKGEILLHNMAQLGFSPQEIDGVFLSHHHMDHTGGLDRLLEVNPNLTLWLPASFPDKDKLAWRQQGATLHEITTPESICPHAFSTGIIEGWIKEQSLILEVNSGTIVLTGCAHPRIVNIISKVKQNFPQPITLLLGGFHLAGFSSREIVGIIQNFRLQEVKRVAPAHCTGEEAIELIAQEYQEDFIRISVGERIEIQ